MKKKECKYGIANKQRHARSGAALKYHNKVYYSVYLLLLRAPTLNYDTNKRPTEGKGTEGREDRGPAWASYCDR